MNAAVSKTVGSKERYLEARCWRLLSIRFSRTCSLVSSPPKFSTPQHPLLRSASCEKNGQLYLAGPAATALSLRSGSDARQNVKYAQSKRWCFCEYDLALFAISPPADGLTASFRFCRF